MALFSGFQLRGDVYHVQTRRGLLDNTLTVKVGDVIKPLSTTDNVYTNASVAGDYYVCGVVVGFSKSNGEVISSGTDPANTPASITTSGTNTTVNKYYAVYLPITPEMEFSATLNAVAGTTGTYTAAEYAGFNLADCRLIGESTGVAFATWISSPLQVVSLGLDPNDTTNFTIICKFVKCANYANH